MFTETPYIGAILIVDNQVKYSAFNDMAILYAIDEALAYIDPATLNHPDWDYYRNGCDPEDLEQCLTDWLYEMVDIEASRGGGVGYCALIIIEIDTRHNTIDFDHMRWDGLLQ